MTRPEPPRDAAPVAGTSFAARVPSPSWERVAVPDGPQCYVWVWYKPANVPHGLILRIPEEMYATAGPLVARWTIRKLLTAAGVDPRWVPMWQLYGVAYDGMNGMSPYLDAAIPPPLPGLDPSIVVYVNAPHVVPVPPGVAPQVTVSGETPRPPADGPLGESAAELFERMESDWRFSLEIEKELVRLRKQLLDMMAKLKTLNRDLTPPERLYANNQDKKEWQDARRWLRDSSTRLWKCVKDHDIGDTSSAGQRKWFEQTYEQFVAPRAQWDGLLQAQRDFETYRKLLQTLQTNMNNAHAMAAIDGERRAQQVLARITAKVREANNRKNFLGLMLD